MRFSEALEHFGGSREALAAALGKARTTTYYWELTGIPEDLQYRLQVVTSGRLQADPPRKRRSRAS